MGIWYPFLLVFQDNHNAIMAKLNFVLDLVECIIELARVRAAPLNTFSESLSCNKVSFMFICEYQQPKLNKCFRADLAIRWA